MARTKKQRKKEKKYKHKGRGYFSANDYNNFLYDNFRHGRRRQRGGFLNRYDFAYAGGNTVNQAAKHLVTLAPKLINQLMSKATTGLDNITAKRVEQISRETGQTLKQTAPGLITAAIEELYKTPFRFLGNLGRKKHKALKKKVFNKLKI